MSLWLAPLRLLYCFSLLSLFQAAFNQTVGGASGIQQFRAGNGAQQQFSVTIPQQQIKLQQKKQQQQQIQQQNITVRPTITQNNINTGTRLCQVFFLQLFL